MQITFRTLHSKSKKKIFQFAIFSSFLLRIRLHLVRGFQKGITLRVLSHISCFGWVVGVARVGGCGLGQVPEHKTPSVIPFWNRLNKCNLNLKRKVEKIANCKIFFFRFTM